MQTIDRRRLHTSLLVTIGSLLMPRIALGAQRRADLVITSLQWSDDYGLTWHNEPVPAQSNVVFRAVVKNSGGAAWPPNHKIRVEFRVNSERVAWSSSYLAGLSRGQSSTLVAANGPDGDDIWNEVAPGSYRIVARVDPGKVLLESNESNNTRSATLTVDPLPNSPDVVVKALRWSEDDGQTWHQAPITAGKNVLFEADVTNQGTGPTPDGVAIRVDFRSDGTPIAWSDDHTTAVGPGQTVSLRASDGPDGDRYWNDVQAGGYMIRAEVDSGDGILELDETNNALDVPVTAQSAPGMSATIGSVSGGGNIFRSEAGSHKIADLVALHCGLARVSCHAKNDYFQGNAPSPSNTDAVVLSLLQNGVQPYFSFVFTDKLDSSQTGIPQRNYADWFAIGQAFAGRFKKGSSFLVSQGITDLGAYGYAAINEPDHAGGETAGLTYTQYHDMLHGLADGVHSSDPGGKVWPAGYLSGNRDQEYTGHGYCLAVADLINDGTLEGFDLHTYHAKSGAKIHDTYDRSHQHDADQFVVHCGITRQDVEIICTETNIRGDPDATAQGYDEATARNWFLTSMFDVWGTLRPDGALAQGPRFPWQLWMQGNPVWHMAEQLEPRVERWCGRTYKMMMALLHDMHFTFNDPRDTGVFKLKGGGKSAWVFQDLHPSWSSLFGTTFTIDDIPAATTQVSAYDGNGLVYTVSTPTLQKPSHTFPTPLLGTSGLGKTWLFIGDAE